MHVAPRLQHEIVNESISQNVEIRFVVPVNQSNPAFGERNANLEGPMVKQDGKLRLIRWEENFYLPLEEEFSSGRAKTQSLKYRVVKTESYTASVAGRFEKGSKVHVVTGEWDQAGKIAKEIATGEATRAVTVFFWYRASDVGTMAATYGVELIDGKISEVLVDQR